MPNLEAKSLKARCVLNAWAISTIQIPNGQPKVALEVAVGARTVRADVNAKLLRRSIAAMSEAGPDSCAMVLSGRLEAGDVLVDAGISAIPRTPKPATVAA
jgi:hypothetical protein